MYICSLNIQNFLFFIFFKFQYLIENYSFDLSRKTLFYCCTLIPTMNYPIHFFNLNVTQNIKLLTGNKIFS